MDLADDDENVEYETQQGELNNGTAESDKLCDTQCESCDILLHFDHNPQFASMLRLQLLKDPEIIFSAFKVPHPLIKTVEVRVQSLSPTVQVVKNNIQVLLGELDKFEKAFDKATL